MLKNIQAFVLILLVAITSPIWIPILIVWAGCNKRSLEEFDSTEELGI